MSASESRKVELERRDRKLANERVPTTAKLLLILAEHKPDNGVFAVIPSNGLYGTSDVVVSWEELRDLCAFALGCLQIAPRPPQGPVVGMRYTIDVGAGSNEHTVTEVLPDGRMLVDQITTWTVSGWEHYARAGWLRIFALPTPAAGMRVWHRGAERIVEELNDRGDAMCDMGWIIRADWVPEHVVILHPKALGVAVKDDATEELPPPADLGDVVEAIDYRTNVSVQLIDYFAGLFAQNMHDNAGLTPSSAARCYDDARTMLAAREDHFHKYSMKGTR